MTHDKQRLIELFNRDALQRGEFTLASGRTSSYYVDGRKVTLSAEGAAIIGSAVMARTKDDPSIMAIGGLTIGADPIVGATLAMAAIGGWWAMRGFLVRKEGPKDHGTGNLIEGPLKPGMIVAIVDDVATSGQSIYKAVQAVEAIGCRVEFVMVVLDRLEGAREFFEHKQKIPFHSLLTIKDLEV